MTWILKTEEQPASGNSFVEIAPGVRASRRFFCRGAFGLAAMFATTSRLLAREAKPSGLMAFKDFEPLLLEEARKLLDRKFADEEEYLQAVIRLLGRLDADTLPRRKGVQIDALKGNWFDLVLGAEQFGSFVITMEPGAALPLHDHRHYNGVILGVSGACDTQYFDIAQSPEGLDAGAPVVLKRTDRIMIEKGAIGSLSRTRNNVHELRAGPEGCVLFDTFAYENDEGHSYFIHTKEDIFGDSPTLRGVWGEQI